MKNQESIKECLVTELRNRFNDGVLIEGHYIDDTDTVDIQFRINTDYHYKVPYVSKKILEDTIDISTLADEAEKHYVNYLCDVLFTKKKKVRINDKT